VVFGRRAGDSLPAFLEGWSGPDRREEEKRVGEALGRFEALFGEGGAEEVPALRREMEETMVASFGLFRSEEAMKAGLGSLEELVERYGKVRVRERSLVFNSGLLRALELGSMLDIAHACARAALNRRESRGGHYRLDFPALDNANFLKHSLTTMGADGSLDLSYRDVTIIDTEPLDEITY
jgi:succinate dehydrogenase / fumarate reductase flavoprotein subunit